MQIVNQTPLAFEAFVSEVEGVSTRVGVLIAKATYRFTPQGGIALDTQEPLPILKMDHESEAGLYPADVVLRRSKLVEVCLLGAAYSGGRPVEAMNVYARVGPHRRDMYVIGDRTWQGEGRYAVPSSPLPFERMPLSWDRAHGGKVDAYVDPKNSVPLQDPWNPLGRGYFPERAELAAVEELGCAPGFPHVRPLERRLPNLENPAAPIRAWGDRPEPWCWATIPMQVPYRAFLYGEYATRRNANRSPEEIEDAEELDPFELFDLEHAHEWDAQWLRAHREWFVALPDGPIEIELGGMSPTVPRTLVTVPDLRVHVATAVDDQRRSLTLDRQNLLIDAEAGCITVVYRQYFNVRHPDETERSLLVRTSLGPEAA